MNKMTKGLKRDLEKQISDFKVLQEQKAYCDAEMKKIKESLEKLSTENKIFFENHKLELEAGKLRFAQVTEIVVGKGFDLKRFVAKFPEYVKPNLSTSMIKKTLENPEGAKKLDGFDLSIKTVEKLVIE